MAFVDLIIVVLFVVMVLVGLRSGFLSALKSLIALILSYAISLFSIKPLMNGLSDVGLRENLYSPMIIFVFILIVIWGVIFAVELNLFKKIDKKIPRWTGVIPGILMGIALCNIIYILLFGLIGEQAIIKQSKICPYFVSKNIFKIFTHKPFISREEAIDGEVIITKEENEIITVSNLPDYAPPSAELKQKILTMINSFRTENGRDSLKEDAKLDVLADNYATEILKTKQFSHLDQSLKMPEDRAIILDIRFNYLGENLAIAPSLEAAHQGLTESSSHRDNLLQPLFRRVGISVRKLNSSSVLVVQEFSN